MTSRKLAKGILPDLQRFEEAPFYQQFNPFIRTGYRVNYTLSQSLRSLFYFTNETLNVWTHLIATATFCVLFVYDLYRTTSNGTLVFTSAMDRILISFFFLVVVFSFFVSAMYHTMSGTSELIFTKCLRLDILGIVMSYSAIHINWTYNTMGCHLPWMVFYFVLFGTITVCLVTDTMSDRTIMDANTNFRRAIIYGSWGFMDLIPIVHCFYLEGGFSSKLASTSLFMLAIQHTALTIAMGFFLSKFPECYLVGKVDFIGNSHQCWHVTIFIGALWIHEALVQTAIVKKDYVCATF